MFRGTSLVDFHRRFPERPHAHRRPLDPCPDPVYLRERVTVFILMARLLM
jgi:hypothetical protein